MKLAIINIVEANPLPKHRLLKMMGLVENKYYRWQKKYYLSSCLEDQRGKTKSKKPRLEDVYRKEIVHIRKQGYIGNTIIGPERIMDALEEAGIILSHETIRKVLHQEGLIERRAISEKHEWKRFEADYVNQMWQMDMLYMFVIGYGYIYLFSVLDDYSRKIIHWELSPLSRAIEARETLKMAIEKNKVKPESVLTDHGIQFYTGAGKELGKFEKYLKSEKIQHILARVRHPQTMGKIERYHRSLRQECLNHHELDDPIMARRIVTEYNEKYNYFRKHKGIGRVTPHQRYTGQDQKIREMRLQLRKQIRQQRMSRMPEAEIQQEVAFQETVQYLKKAFSKEVVLV